MKFKQSIVLVSILALVQWALHAAWRRMWARRQRHWPCHGEGGQGNRPRSEGRREGVDKGTKDTGRATEKTTKRQAMS